MICGRSGSIFAIGAAVLIAVPSVAADCTLRAGVSVEKGRSGVCGFNPTARVFQGTAADQARCLTRRVGRGAALGEPTLPDAFASLLLQPISTDTKRLKAYLSTISVDEREVGGPLERRIGAAYFIIHDTSTPNCSEKGVPTNSCPHFGELPAQRDTATWRDNATFQGHPKKSPNRIANIFVNRVGGSITEVDLADPFITTKFEQCADSASKRGLFVGVENIQPRIGVPAKPALGKRANDLIAPTPGFTLAQYDRLALSYVVASVRRGVWLIPAFHAVIDSRYRQGHDDPQNFDTAAFTVAVERHRTAVARQVL